MTAVTPTDRSFVLQLRPAPRSVPATQGARSEPYPARAPGVGYGNSSGYATARRYARGWNGQPLFRCS